jgi:hypothetical protein
MPTKTALCIGINNYPGTQNDLYGCVNDANDWAAELQRKGYTVKMLLDAKATSKNILKEMHAMLTKTKPGDSVVIQYSGHGSYVPDEDGDEPDGMDECICPHDIVSADGSNNFITMLKAHWPEVPKCLIISSEPDNEEMNDSFLSIYEKAFRLTGLCIDKMNVCDRRNESSLAGMLREYNIVILAGGHVPTQNRFLTRLKLKELLKQLGKNLLCV